MRVCERDGCDNEVVGRSDKRFCCKKCFRDATKERKAETNAAWRAENKERIAKNNAAWGAANKERKAETSAAWYAANKDRKAETDAAWYAANKDRQAEANAAWYAANKERKAETDAAWKAANPEKTAEYQSRYRARKACAVPQRWVKRTDAPDDLCYWCGSCDVAHIDHVMPISLGGPAVESNEVPSCADCNLRKSAKHPLVWIAELIEKDI